MVLALSKEFRLAKPELRNYKIVNSPGELRLELIMIFILVAPVLHFIFTVFSKIN